MALDDLTRLKHILESAQQAVGFVRGRSRAELDNDPMLSLALVRLLEIIGEAARGVSGSTQSGHPEVPWGKMAGMRDRLIHGYFDVNLGVVWRTVTEDLPSLIEVIRPLSAPQPDP